MIKKGIIFIVLTSFLFSCGETDTSKEDIIIKNELKEIEVEETQKDEQSYTEMLDDLQKAENSIEEAYPEEETLKETEDEISSEEKLQALKKRFAVKGTILKGDYYFNHNQPVYALMKYSEALKKAPDDEEILKKIGDTYFELNNYKKSYKYYFPIRNKEDVVENFILSIMYGHDFSIEENIKLYGKVIKELDIGNEEKFYYLNSLVCLKDIHECKKNFGDYFEKNTIIKDKKLIKIKNAIERYEDFNSGNLYYKNALIVGAFFENKAYPIAVLLGEDILSKMPDYKPILKVVGKSMYEIGKYKEANKILQTYYEKENKDVETTYLLGVINFKTGDYISSNLYFNSALKNGYTPQIDLKRRLVYNYYLLKDYDSMISTFSELLEEDNSEKDDFSLAIYNSIISGRELLGLKWTEKAINKFKDDNDIFYGYAGWIYRERGDLQKSDSMLKKGLSKNPRNPMLLLNMGYLREKMGNLKLAAAYFKKTMEVNKDGEFGILAKKRLLEYNEKAKEQENLEKNEKLDNINSSKN